MGFNVSYNAATNTVQIDSSAPYQDDTAEPQAGRIVTIPQSDENFVLKVSDRVRCDDGTLYKIKDMSRYDTNVFAEGPLPPLPTPTCDWSLFPQSELPKVEVKHYSDQHGDDLFVTNLYELRRMEYTIRNALGKEPDAWRGDQLLAKINLTIPPEYQPYTGVFWPWRESEDAVYQGYFRKQVFKERIGRGMLLIVSPRAQHFQQTLTVLERVHVLTALPSRPISKGKQKSVLVENIR